MRIKLQGHNKTRSKIFILVTLLEVSCFSLKEPTQYSGENIDFYELKIYSAYRDIIKLMDKLEVSVEGEGGILKIDDKKFQIVIADHGIKFDTPGAKIDAANLETIINKKLYDHKDNKGRIRLFALKSDPPKRTGDEKKNKKNRSGAPSPSIVIIKEKENKLMFYIIPRSDFEGFFHYNIDYRNLLEADFGFNKFEIGNLKTNTGLKERYIDSLKQKTPYISKKYDFNSFVKDMDNLTSKNSWKVLVDFKKSESIGYWDIVPAKSGLFILCKTLSEDKRFFLIPSAEYPIITPMKRVYEY